MKFFMKKPEQPAESAPKQPKEKNPLLQTYVVSLLSLVLCAAMFLGTSYAWFTSEVTNITNEIYIGILDVGLFRQGETQREDLSDNAYKLFDRNIRWEPGYTSLETIHVVNEGDLAFKYVLNFTDGKLDDQVDPMLQDVAQYFDVWIYHDEENKIPEATTYDQITAPGSGWVNVGPLDRLLAGEAVLSGMMDAEEVREENLDPTLANEGTTDGKATEKTYTIALHMQEDAVLAVMGRRITLNVKLVAYQMGSEQDSFDSRYDQMVSSQAELAAALENGGTVALAADISLTEGVTVPKDTTVILDLNGHAIRFQTTAGNCAITNKGTLTINDAGTAGKIELLYDGTAADGKAANAIRNEGNLTINGGEISNSSATEKYQIGYAVDNYGGSSLTVNGGKITVSGSNYYDAIRLFCGDKEIVVTVNGGEISSIWAQNPTDNQSSPVNGTVILNGGTVEKTFFENYTTVKVATNLTATVTHYGSGKDNATVIEVEEGDYKVYTFEQTTNP